MTFWLDAQLDPDLATWLGSRFTVTAKHLVELGLEAAADHELYEAGRRFREIVIVTKDSDFVYLSRQRGQPPQVVHLGCGNLGTIAMQIWLSSTFADALRRLQAGEAVVSIVGPNK